VAAKRFTLQGGAALERALKQLPKKLEKRVVENALTAGGRVVAKKVAENAPEDTGALADSVVVRRKAPKRRREPGLVFLGFQPPVSRRAHLTEYGTRYQKAQPFIRPAIDSEARAFFQKVGARIAKGLEREAAKLAKGPKARKRR
jgi:HK97 gp10 family phage protein